MNYLLSCGDMGKTYGNGARLTQHRKRKGHEACEVVRRWTFLPIEKVCTEVK